LVAVNSWVCSLKKHKSHGWSALLHYNCHLGVFSILGQTKIHTETRHWIFQRKKTCPANSPVIFLKEIPQIPLTDREILMLVCRQ
jgi:hypothetical protein